MQLGLRSAVRGFALARSASRQVPHGGKLVENMAATPPRVDHAVQLTERQLCDVELLMNGGFSPLEGFMNKATYDSVVSDMRLPARAGDSKGLLWGIPIVYDTADPEVKPGKNVLLQHNGQDIAVLEVDEVWQPNKVLECYKTLGTSALEHPGARVIAFERKPNYVGGKIHGLNLPARKMQCKTPAALRAELPDTDVVAFQCRNPIHRAHYELLLRATGAPNVGDGAVVLVHPTCGPTQEDDISGDVRFDTYEVLQKEEPNAALKWAYLPYNMLLGGPREAVMHMTIRKNYGCTHFIIGRDMAGSKSSITSEDFYGAYDAQDFAAEHSAELGVQTVPSINIVYTEEKGFVTDEDAKAQKLKINKLSGTEFRRRLRAGEDIPDWFAFPSVVKVLRESVKKN